MKLEYFGDSYDIVKKSLICWLSEFGQWVTHPMFTEEITDEQATGFSRLIGTPLLSTDVLRSNTNRAEYFCSCREAGNLFLDPDKGVCIAPQLGAKAIQYVFAAELVELCQLRPTSLTVVFDQSYSRGISKEKLMRDKLNHLAKNGITGCIYDSHATFLLLGADTTLVNHTWKRVVELSALPEWRFFR